MRQTSKLRADSNHSTYGDADKAHLFRSDRPARLMDLLDYADRHRGGGRRLRGLCHPFDG